MCTRKGAKYLLFLAIAPQGKRFGISYLDSHIYISRLYIFWVCFFLANAPQGKIFWVLYPDYWQNTHTKFFGISDCFFTGKTGENSPSPTREEIWDISEENSPQFGRKKKHCQTLASLVKFFLPKLALLAKSLSASGSLRSPKTVCKRLAARCLRAHVCAVCLLTPPLFPFLNSYLVYFGFKSFWWK